MTISYRCLKRYNQIGLLLFMLFSPPVFGLEYGTQELLIPMYDLPREIQYTGVVNGERVYLNFGVLCQQKFLGMVGHCFDARWIYVSTHAEVYWEIPQEHFRDLASWLPQVDLTDPLRYANQYAD